MIDADIPVNTAILLVRLSPRRLAICELVKASLRATRKPMANNGRGLFRSRMRTAWRLCPTLNSTTSDNSSEATKIPALVA
ncbi:hypothetical protein D3C78_1829990 [compost metagenome]